MGGCAVNAGPGVCDVDGCFDLELKKSVPGTLFPSCRLQKIRSFQPLL